MHSFYLTPKQAIVELKKSRQSSIKVKFKSERKQLDPKTKELLTKYRKGLIWKEI